MLHCKVIASFSQNHRQLFMKQQEAVKIRRDDTFRVNNMRNYFPVMVVGYKGYHLLTIK